MEGYRYVDALLAERVDVFAYGQSRHLLELNHRVLCGITPERRTQFAAHLAETERRFYDRGDGGIGELHDWVQRNRTRPARALAAGVFVHAVSTPQLFIEGNRRTAVLVASYLLARGGLPPVVVTAASYPALRRDHRARRGGRPQRLCQRHRADAGDPPRGGLPPGDRRSAVSPAVGCCECGGPRGELTHPRQQRTVSLLALGGDLTQGGGTRPEPPMPSTLSLPTLRGLAGCAGDRRRDRCCRRLRRRRSRRRPPRRSEGARLPADKTTRHQLTLDDRSLAFSATAGAITLTSPASRPEADIAFVAYVLDGPDRASRPVTFAINGGPGAASAYLDIGVLGPWRLPMDADGIVPSQPVALVPNAETWLDFTDLVFIDPVGTGFSRLVNPDDALRERYLSVDGDVAAISDFIRRWLVENGREGSPKYFVGESYGGFRGPLVAERLQTEDGVGLSGMTLLSPVLDFGWWRQPGYAPMPKVSLLPSLAAVAMEERGAFTPEGLHAAEDYASGAFVTDLLRGVRDPAAVERIVERVDRADRPRPRRGRARRRPHRRARLRARDPARRRPGGQRLRSDGRQPPIRRRRKAGRAGPTRCSTR